ncbi:hypothetical protein ALP05_02348 [Pseudomonas caricapapayae]|uniref:Uncharacterized protein n=1 Tax=Pseudomonas caricapapayae TaxID=46678 RepID=A0A3M6EQ92_9PSED|nr:hypothetical protein [Pseudomonas caricapapayae]RMV69956.1 hypothetical protein ALP05_02348 [Pseudomonas caricapapayae]
MTNPKLIWTTHKLADGWVLLCVDANLEQPGEPEAMLGVRRAVHPFDFDEARNPVIAFTLVIAEMTHAIMWGVNGVQSATLLPASRARAFGA